LLLEHLELLLLIHLLSVEVYTPSNTLNCTYFVVTEAVSSHTKTAGLQTAEDQSPPVLLRYFEPSAVKAIIAAVRRPSAARYQPFVGSVSSRPASGTSAASASIASTCSSHAFVPSTNLKPAA
jgi:hypothetical protein